MKTDDPAAQDPCSSRKDDRPGSPLQSESVVESVQPGKRRHTKTKLSHPAQSADALLAGERQHAKTKLLHVGFPKCMSTTLQRDIFAKHPEIEFLGWGVPGTEHGWTDDALAALCEVSIRYEKVLDYDSAAASELMQRHMAKFEDNPHKKVLCLSFESFSFTMHFDVDATIKADRLKSLLGKNTKIIIVVRNQLDLFSSYYFECVRGGYPGQFLPFLDYHFHYLFHSILSDLRYHKIFELYARLFGRDNVKVVPMERLVKNPGVELNAIYDFAGVQAIELPLEKHNNSNDPKYLQAVRLLNEKFPNNRGNTYFGWVDPEKLAPYWRSRELSEPGELVRNYTDRMMIHRSAKNDLIDFVMPLDCTYPDDWRERICALYAESNSALASETGLDLESLGYPCLPQNPPAPQQDSNDAQATVRCEMDDNQQGSCGPEAADSKGGPDQGLTNVD